jgi:hypothetical protein
VEFASLTPPAANNVRVTLNIVDLETFRLRRQQTSIEYPAVRIVLVDEALEAWRTADTSDWDRYCPICSDNGKPISMPS